MFGQGDNWKIIGYLRNHPRKQLRAHCSSSAGSGWYPNITRYWNMMMTLRNQLMENMMMQTIIEDKMMMMTSSSGKYDAADEKRWGGPTLRKNGQEDKGFKWRNPLIMKNQPQVKMSANNMYAKWWSIDKVGELFDLMSQRNVVSSNAMIARYAQNGFLMSLETFKKMQLAGVKPNSTTLANILLVYA